MKNRCMYSNKLRKGFTIVEILVAMFLLSIVVSLPLTDLFIRTNLRVRRMQTALQAERDLLERIRGAPYDSPFLQDDGGGADLTDMTNPDYFVDSTTIYGMRMRRFYNVQDDAPSPGMKTIRVFVLWQGLRDTTAHVVSAVTIKNARW